MDCSQNTFKKCSIMFNMIAHLCILKAIFHGSMNSIFERNIRNLFLIYGPNIDYGCLLGKSNETQSVYIFIEKNKRMHTAANPTFFLFNVGFKRGAYGTDWLMYCYQLCEMDTLKNFTLYREMWGLWGFTLFLTFWLKKQRLWILVKTTSVGHF